MPSKTKKRTREVVRILGRDIDLRRDENSPGCTDTSMGRSSVAASSIWVSPHISQSEAVPTITHECLHIISGLLMLGLTESQVCGLEVALTGMGFKPQTKMV